MTKIKNPAIENTNQISLLINRAEIDQVTVTKGGIVRANIDLYSGSEPVTSMMLSNESFYKGSPSYIMLSPTFQILTDKLFAEIKRYANISLDRAGNQLVEPADVVEHNPDGIGQPICDKKQPKNSERSS